MTKPKKINEKTFRDRGSGLKFNMDLILNIGPVFLSSIVFGVIIFLIVGFSAAFLSLSFVLLSIPYFIFVGGFFALIFSSFFNLGDLGEYMGMGVALIIAIIYCMGGSDSSKKF